jgi:fibronectin type III domain protein
VLVNFPNSPAGPIAFGDVDNDGKPDLVAFGYLEIIFGHLLGRYTAVVRSTDLAPPPPPAAPSNVRLTSPTRTTLTATWQNNSSDTHFFALEGLGYRELPATVTEVTFESLEPDTEYCLKVSAFSPSYSPKLPERATDVAESRNSIHVSGCETESRID